MASFSMPTQRAARRIPAHLVQCTVIVATGKTVDQIKMMHVMEKQKHAEACNKNRSISATSVNELHCRGR